MTNESFSGAHSSPSREGRPADDARHPSQVESRADTTGATGATGGESGSSGGGSFGAGIDHSSGGGDSSGSSSGSSRRGRRGRRGGRKKSSSGSAAATTLEGTESDEQASASGTRRKSKGRRRSTRRTKSDEGSAVEPAVEPAVESAGEEGEKKRSTRKRSTRKKRKSGSTESEGSRSSTALEEDDQGTAKRRRSRGTRGGRGRKKRTSEAVEIESIPGEHDELPPELDADGRSEGDDGKRKRRSKAQKRDKKVSSGKRTAVAEPVGDQVILVNAEGREETRVAVVENGRIVDMQMTVDRHRSYVSDIYRGRVVNLEPAIGAAFVDFGQGRNGFLHASDVLAAYGESDWSLEKLLTTRVEADEWDDDSSQPEIGAELVEENGEPEDGDAPPKGRKTKSRKKVGKSAKTAKAGRSTQRSSRHRGPRLPITDLLQKGQLVVVQVTKDAIGDKGPTLTTYISIPGRYIVLMPSLARTGVSRKIEDERERKRLKRILQSLEIPAGMGVIVRTAGVGKTKTELKRDLDYLLASWEDFGRRLTAGRNPMPLYQESDVAIRTMRDLFSSNTKAVYVDDESVHDRMREFTQSLMPEFMDRVQLCKGERPLFHTHGVEQDFEKVFSRRVELPAGGSIVIDQTEALVAIDVNSGKTRGEGTDFEDVALKTNLEAAPEIARQIRLRDLGGIIVLDFIDMMRTSNRRTVEKVFRDALATDRARSKVGRISQFGLLELTRQRLGPGLEKLLFTNCPVCRGSGRRRTVESRVQAILRRLGSALSQKGFSTVEVRADPEVIAFLQKHCRTKLGKLEQSSGRELRLTGVADQLEDSVLRYLRADGREVRPGGRRKR